MNHIYLYIWDVCSDFAIDMPALLTSHEKKNKKQPTNPNTLGMTREPSGKYCLKIKF